mmetsp:Transcript_21612/g.50370  ORF Transcript_21612/g.50370 Transcript_21612/m.50370 type:complete len:129 (-) Transcript_21612:542-928(-)
MLRPTSLANGFEVISAVKQIASSVPCRSAIWAIGNTPANELNAAKTSFVWSTRAVDNSNDTSSNVYVECFVESLDPKLGTPPVASRARAAAPSTSLRLSAGPQKGLTKPDWISSKERNSSGVPDAVIA